VSSVNEAPGPGFELLLYLVMTGEDLTSLAVVMTGKSSKLVRDKLRFETNEFRAEIIELRVFPNSNLSSHVTSSSCKINKF
jgi:hypothetical protein